MLRVKEIETLCPARHKPLAAGVLQELVGVQHISSDECAVSKLAERLDGVRMYEASDLITVFPLGFLALQLDNQTAAYPTIKYCLVDSDYRYTSGRRGIGIGSMLVNHAIAVCQAKAPTELHLRSIEAAVPFYKRLGFEPINNTLAMRKIIF